MIRFTNVTKSYGRGGTALADVSLFIAKGEFVFFTGASGAGKSTLLRHVYMDERPTAGEVRVGGYRSVEVSRRDVARLRRKLGIVFQDFRLLEDRTAEANVAFALEVIGTPRSAIRARVARALHQVGLSTKGTSMPGELSGGERQRVAIARAIVNDPFVLVADEPTGNLDDRASRGVFELLAEINARGTAVLMATHDLELIRRAEFRTVELAEGRVIHDSAEGSTPLPIMEDG
ncbi:MAG: cell division ATP-binding protein FtsE [Gemmatimonadaceae bacterium]